MTSTSVVMISRSCIPTLDFSAALLFDPGEFILFKLMGKLQTEGAPETAAAIASESVACVEIIKKVRAASRTWSLCESAAF